MGEKTIVRGAAGEVGRGRQMGVPKLDTFLNTSFSTFVHQKIKGYVAFEITIGRLGDRILSKFLKREISGTR